MTLSVLRGRALFLLLVAMALAACGQAPDAVAGHSPAAPASAMSARQAAQLPLPELRAHITALESRGGAQALERGRLLRVLALREGDGVLLGHARQALAAARDGDAAQGCAAGLELARLEARDAWDAAAARTAAEDVVRDFGDQPSAAPCVAEATRLLAAVSGLVRPSETSQPSAELSAVDVLGASEGARGVRVVVRMSGAAEFERESGDGGDHLALRLRALSVSDELTGTRRVDAGGLRQIRVERSGAGALLAFELESGAEVSLFSLADPDRIVLDIARHAAATHARAGPPRLIVLDPGHGGNDWGARNEGLEEADLVLDIAARTARSLSILMPHTRVLLTRREDRFLDLPSRTAMANALAADLFVSIHLNSADDEVTHGGVTTFVLDTGNERQALRLAARENGTTTADVGQLSRVLAHLYRREQVAASRALATRVQAETLAAARRTLPSLPDRGVQQAMFHVLVGARMPAILVEASFLTEPREAAQLRRAAYRQDLADGMARGIAGYAASGFAPGPSGSHTSAP